MVCRFLGQESFQRRGIVTFQDDRIKTVVGRQRGAGNRKCQAHAFCYLVVKILVVS
jgi:hypothetical protein